MIITVSDVHLGYDKCNYKDFRKFLDKCNTPEVEHLVLLGDIFDFWRVNMADIVLGKDMIGNDVKKDYSAIFEMLGALKAQNIHYVPGNHDYFMLSLNERYQKGYDKNVYPFTISKTLRLVDGDSKFYFNHGYALDVFLNMGFMDLESYESLSYRLCFSDKSLRMIANDIWDFIQHGEVPRAKMQQPPQERANIDGITELARSKGVYLLLGMKPEEKLVFGHTHIPFINENSTVANSGSWVSDRPSKYPPNSYVKIIDGQMELKYFNENEPL